MNEPTITRRAFTESALRSLLLFSLAGVVKGKDVLAAAIRPIAGHWLAELDELAKDVSSEKIKQVEWQKKVEELLGKVDLEDFLRLIDFEKLAKRGDYKGKGAKSLHVDFPQVEGVPTRFVFGNQIFALKKGRSIVPHGHDNMATAFLMLRGKCRGRHYERLADEKEHMIITPTIDKEFGPGGASSISDHKDNVHWFEATTDSAFIFNIHVMDVDPKSQKTTGRVYVDPNGEKLKEGKVRARVIDEDEAERLYG